MSAKLRPSLDHTMGNLAPWTSLQSSCFSCSCNNALWSCATLMPLACRHVDNLARCSKSCQTHSPARQPCLLTITADHRPDSLPTNAPLHTSIHHYPDNSILRPDDFHHCSLAGTYDVCTGCAGTRINVLPPAVPPVLAT
ncbi:hypothetical protein BDW02DRAFT_156157 [Decorospora gaudefroyi]|uniref:Uncharacterized protein n=1 Tax=Decorospora gaudefroyi TaxID=184978 RepID=A0A6A5KLZ2_9PLEO|nr:hypothetical protein BDW02DRAFT_156157 [Decorospora gaudefroyi]